MENSIPKTLTLTAKQIEFVAEYKFAQYNIDKLTDILSINTNTKITIFQTKLQNGLDNRGYAIQVNFDKRIMRDIPSDKKLACEVVKCFKKIFKDENKIL